MLFTVGALSGADRVPSQWWKLGGATQGAVESRSPPPPLAWHARARVSGGRAAALHFQHRNSVQKRVSSEKVNAPLPNITFTYGSELIKDRLTGKQRLEQGALAQEPVDWTDALECDDEWQDAYAEETEAHRETRRMRESRAEKRAACVCEECEEAQSSDD